MCSVDEEDHDGDKYMEEVASVNLIDQTCKKCRTQKATLTLRKKDNYCDDCFVAGVTHKFRSTFGKSRLIKPGEKVLVVHNGNLNSSILLYLINQGVNENTHKKLQFLPHVLYLDDGIIKNLTKEERQINISIIETQAKSHSLPFHSVCISQMMADDIELNSSLNKNERLESQFKQFTTSLKTQTAHHDMLKKLKRNLLLRCCKKLECSYALLAETATELAATLLASVALGAASQISSDIGFSDTRDEKVKILRPLKDLTSEDIALFNKMHNLSCIVENENPKDYQYASIQSLTEYFINNLHNNFPATVSTVLKTGDKIENSSVKTDEEEKCAMCQSPLDTNIFACSSVEATLFSKETSNDTVPSDCLSNQDQNCSNCSCGSTGMKSLTREDINLFMCYSCRLIIRDIKNVDFLPPTLLTNINNKRRIQNIKNSIQDFLL